jgi:hypothetical protein
MSRRVHHHSIAGGHVTGRRICTKLNTALNTTSGNGTGCRICDLASPGVDTWRIWPIVSGGGGPPPPGRRICDLASPGVDTWLTSVFGVFGVFGERMQARCALSIGERAVSAASDSQRH